MDINFKNNKRMGKGDEGEGVCFCGGNEGGEKN